MKAFATCLLYLALVLTTTGCRASELRTLGFDPVSTPNVKILTYLDLIQRFIPNASISLKDLQPDVRDCIESKDCCHAYEMELDMTNNKRFGNLALDIFGFDRRTKTSGWTFKALIIVKDDVVAYKIRSGEPNVDRIDRRTKPLGPLQELDNILLKLVGSM